MIVSAPIRIKTVDAGSLAHRAGLRQNDTVLAINGEPVIDEFDFAYLCAQESLSMEIARARKRRRIEIMRRPGEPLGALPAPLRIRRCRNRCVFCFIDQMPQGLRKSLYVKDEDLNLSFHNGNYLTLTSFSDADLRRIADRGISPIYVSVHATVRRVRNRMLGNPRAPDIMGQLRLLTRRDMALHTQIVVCPGMNDGAVLARSLDDLAGLGDNLLSIAVVPVGITRHRARPLAACTDNDARTILALASEASDRDLRATGRRRIFCADELFLAAGRPVPPARYYAGYPQIENGVGLVRRLLTEWARLRFPQRKLPRTGRSLIVTSVLARPFLARIAGDIRRRMPGTAIEAIAAENRFFGAPVTVAGLLTARDVIRTVRSVDKRPKILFLPPAMFNRRGHTLDGWSAGRMGAALGAHVIVPGSLHAMVRHASGGYNADA
jgi:putative radical SAM enzyme (TIGR03279 family)